MITIDGTTKNITGTSFRLIYNNKVVIALIEGTEKTITSTRYKVKEFNTKQEALDEIDILGLEYTQEIEQELISNPELEIF